MSNLAEFKESIESAYDRLGHQLGWRFLFTPARTLAPETRLAFVALNPGDDVYHAPILSVESGNAYRTEIENWWGARGQGLQTQVRLLYEQIALRTDGATWKELMDEQTLALNFCPFRSQGWPPLVSPDGSIEFSRRMWARVFDVVEPSVIVCLGNDPMRYLDLVLRARGAVPTGPAKKRPVGWGNVTYAVAHYTKSPGEVTMVGLPHLSRFRIFGRPESQHATTDIVETISAALQRATATT
jgi:hypothetical protein